MQSILSFIGMLILPASVLIVIRGIIELRQTLAFIAASRKIVGTIVEIKEESGVRERVYFPVVEFRLNKTIRFTGSLPSRCQPHYKIGETVGVRYLPEKPEIARIDSFGQLWGNGLLAFSTGALFLGAALFFLSKL